MFFFPRIVYIWRPLLRQHWAAIGCTKKLSANKSDCTLKDELLSYLQGMGCTELEKNNFNEHPVLALEILRKKSFGKLYLAYLEMT